MVTDGNCQIFNNGKLINCDILDYKHIQEKGRVVSRLVLYRCLVLKDDIKYLVLNTNKPIFIYIDKKNSKYYDKIVEYKQCIIKKEFSFLPFLSKYRNILLYIQENECKIHNSIFILRNEKIKKITNKI
jgi:hypothetical protein